MNKRTHMQFIPAMLLSACILAGCSESTGMEDTTLPEMLPEPQAKLELKLHLDSAIQTGSENDYITAFAKLHPEVTLIVEDYSEIPRPDYRKKLAAELMAGKGPDVIVNSNYLGTNSMENLTKLLQNDVFLDISELSVNLDGCTAAVMEAGMFEGRQYAAIRYCVCRSI